MTQTETEYKPMDFVGGEVFSVDKPLHWTSFDVVKRVRGALLRRLGKKKFKVGHAGTLDPLASGVMVICTGKATKLIDELQAGVKEYIAQVRLGATTPSFDLETDIDATFSTAHLTMPMILEALQKFVGEIEQIPPAFSACKVNGHRAYKAARRGEAVELKPKLLVIDEIELLDYNPSVPEITIRVVCSKGTYIRALARDIGEVLNCGGHLTGLRRTKVGGFTLNNSMTVGDAVDMVRNAPIVSTDENQEQTEIEK